VGRFFLVEAHRNDRLKLRLRGLKRHSKMSQSERRKTGDFLL
jgi:hypothetical protein